MPVHQVIALYGERFYRQRRLQGAAEPVPGLTVVLYRIRQRDVVNGDGRFTAVVVSNQQQIPAEAGAVSLFINNAHRGTVVAIFNIPELAVVNLYVPLIFIDAAFPAFAIQCDRDNGTGGQIFCGAGKQNAVDTFLIVHRIIISDRIEMQHR